MVFVQKFDVYTFLGNPSGAILMFFYAATTRPTTWAREDSMERVMSQRNKMWQSNSGGESHHVCLYESGTVSKSEVSFFSAISFWIFPTTCNFDFGHLWCHTFQLVDDDYDLDSKWSLIEHDDHAGYDFNILKKKEIPRLAKSPSESCKSASSSACPGKYFEF